MTTPTKRAHAHAAARSDREIESVKSEYRDKLRSIQAAFTPPLSNGELSAALGLADGAARGGGSDVGRFVSEAPRLRRARPNTDVRALIDSLIEGELLIGVQDGVPGARRATIICTADDLPRLERAWQVRSMIVGEVQHAQTGAPQWDDAFSWDTFGGGRGGAVHGAMTSSRWVGRHQVSSIGLGAMRLSTTDLDPEAARDVLLAALDRGVRLIDTADSYSLGEKDIGANERLIGEVLTERDAWDDVLVATKVGLKRPGGRWVPNGRPDHLKAAAEASLKALGVDALPLLQLHVIDRDVPLAESLGALIELRDAGKVVDIGVCNVSPEQAQEAYEIAQIISVQNPVSFSSPGVARDEEFMRWCHEHGVALIAHSPLAGHRRVGALRKNRTLLELGTFGSPESVALRWLLGLGPGVIPIPGATRRESILASADAASERLSGAAEAKLDARHQWAGPLRRELWARRATSSEGSVLVMGIPAAGKTTSVAPFTRRGYVRFNRDTVGGSLAALTKSVREHLAAGGRRIVADNTYPTKRSRGEMIRAAEEHGLPTACMWVQTSTDDALFNACWRMLDRCGRLLSPEEMKIESKLDPNLFPPGAVFRFEQLFEEPTLDEGFESVVPVAFNRRLPDGFDNRALILDYDGTLRTTTSGAPYPRDPDEIEILPNRTETLQRYVDDGFRLVGVSNQAGIARGDLTQEQADACFSCTNELLGFEIDVRYSQYAAGSWCRKPMPGLGVFLIREHALDPAKCVMVGDMDSDRIFARTCGFTYSEATHFFE